MVSIDKKNEILNAAIDCFSRYGYEKTTLDDIGKIVGLNKASLYYYYKNKEAIYGDVIHTEANDAIQAFREKLGKIQGCKNRLECYIDGKMAYMHRLLNLHQLSMDQLRSSLPVFEPIYRQIYEQEIGVVDEILKACQNQNEIRNCDTRRIAETIMVVIDAIKLKAFHGKDVRLVKDMDYDSIKEDMTFAVHLIIDGLKPNSI